MFVVLLKFTGDRSKAGAFMEDHNAWIRNGFDDGVFSLVGSLQPGLGGALIAHTEERAALEARVKEDPFVREAIVTPEILEISPARTDERLAFLMN